MNKHTAIKVYAKTNLTVQQLQVVKAYAYGTVGRDYDYKGLIGFVSGSDGAEDKNWCSENVVESYMQVGTKTSVKPSYDSAPDDIERYMETDEAKFNGWKLINTYNC